MTSPFSQIETGGPTAAPVSASLRHSRTRGDHAVVGETADLRKQPLYKESADLLAYGPPAEASTSTPQETHTQAAAPLDAAKAFTEFPISTQPQRLAAAALNTTMATTELPIGTQARFIAAAATAARSGFPLNTQLTLRWTSLFSDNDVNRLRPLPGPERIAHLVEHIRKWLARRGMPPFYIWAREAAGPEAEHWHFAFHLPKAHHMAFAAYVAELTGEPRLIGRTWAGRSTGEFARGEIGSWHLAADVHPERQGYFLAAYLGKGEPSQRLFRGKLRDNDRKPVRGLSFGGDQPDGKYDADQGLIIGTRRRADRFFISKPLQKRVKEEVAAAAT